MKVVDQSRPFFLTKLVLKKWKIAVFIGALFLVYGFATYFVIADELASLNDINVEDYFDQEDERTKKFFVELTLKNTFALYNNYIRKDFYTFRRSHSMK